ncbi:MAG: CDP-alcohol phosphatidyltransferase family protein [Acidobacteriota bacterium]
MADLTTIHPATGWDDRLYVSIRRGRDVLLAPLVAPLAWLGVPPLALSVCGVLLAASLIWTLVDYPRWANFGFFGALLCDGLDGALARRRGCDSRRGKLWDQLCDSATWAAVLLAILAAGLAPVLPTALAVYLVPTLLFLGVSVSSLRGPMGFNPRAGFYAHAPKIFVYGALAAYLLAGRHWIAPAVLCTDIVGAASCLTLLWLLRRRDALPFD